MVIVIRGNLTEGFTYHGPFASFDDATFWDDYVGNGDGWIASLHNPMPSPRDTTCTASFFECDNGRSMLVNSSTL